MKKTFSFYSFVALFGLIIATCGFLAAKTFVYAADVTGLLISVTPNPMTPGEAGDMTITAVDSEWKTVSNYKGTIIIDFENYQDPNVYDMPSNWFYTFLEEDQGKKTFNKGFVIKKPWKFVLKVYDNDNDSIVGTLPLSVWEQVTSSTGEKRQIQLQEPLPNAQIKWSALNIIWFTDSRKTPLQFFIDDEQVSYTGETDDSGVFSVFLTQIKDGDHSLVVKMTDYQNAIIWESESISFSYQSPQTDEFLQSFTANPDGEIALGQLVTFSAKTDSVIKSIELMIGTGDMFIMDKIDNGNFSKSLKINKEWVQKINITLVFDGGKRVSYEDMATLHVTTNTPLKDPEIGIGILKAVNDAANPSQATLSWTPYGKPASYLIRYGTSQDNLTQEVKVKETQVKLSGLEIGKKYYFQVFAVNAQWKTEGIPSDIAMIMTQWQQEIDSWVNSSAPSCAVVGIKLSTQKIGDEYFLVRDAVSGAVEYRIYRSDYEVNSIENMKKIGTSTIPQFSYPFNQNAQQDEYSYYSVVAICSDGTNLQIDNVKKVHTWPVSDTILLLIIASLGYMMIRIYRYRY